MMDADAALACGFVHHVVPEAEVMSSALAFAQKYASVSKPLALHEKLAKRLGVSGTKAGPELVATLQRVNAEESDILEKAWVSSQCLTALANFMKSRNNAILGLLMNILNWLGFLWGQPTVNVARPGFRN